MIRTSVSNEFAGAKKEARVRRPRFYEIESGKRNSEGVLLVEVSKKVLV